MEVITFLIITIMTRPKLIVASLPTSTTATTTTTTNTYNEFNKINFGPNSSSSILYQVNNNEKDIFKNNSLNDIIKFESPIKINLITNRSLNSSKILINNNNNNKNNNKLNSDIRPILESTKIQNDFLIKTNLTIELDNQNENLNKEINFSDISVSDSNLFNLIKLNRTKKPKPLHKNLTSILKKRPIKVNEVFERERKKFFDFRNLNKIQNQNYINKIMLLGLFELSTKNGIRPEGQSELGAATLAVKHINKKNFLPGYQLELLTNDTQCDPGVGVDRFFHALYTQNSTRMIMLLGSACSEVTESLAKVVPYWNIVQVSFGSTSPALSDRQEFPFFYRTVAPDSSHNLARIAFIRKFGWDTVTTFSQNEEVHSLAVNDLVTELENSNITCAATITFAETDFKEQLLLLRDLDTRIIIGSFSQELAPKIFCEAYKLGMFGADYAWILHENMSPPWYEYYFGSTECQYNHLMTAIENLIIVSSYNSIVGNKISLSGLNNEMFTKELNDMNVPEPLSRYAPQTYDAVWAIALALRGAEENWRHQSSNFKSKLESFDYTRQDMAKEFLQQMGKLDFLGVSGPVSFSGPDRIGTTVFYQIQHGLSQPVALYYPAKNNLDFKCPNCIEIKWQSGQVPIAKRIFKLRITTISPLAFYTIAILSLVGIGLSIAFLAFNLHFRKLKAIKLSSPKLSNITAFGCILVYAAVILLGLDNSTLTSSENTFSTVCTARVCLLSAGFSLAFGSMFAKTYRVHRIFTRSGSNVCKDKMLQDTQLISLVCALLILDGLVVTFWILTDPIERNLNNLTVEISATDRSVVYQHQVEVCRSQYTQSWLGALYAYKGLLLIVGVYMAWETRHVKIPALNDSQYIGISVYSVVITSAIVVLLANLISERVTLAFVTITTLILISTTATLCLLFIPKLHDIWSRNDIVDPVIHSMGLKMECNTRRFVIDEKRELQYRVEVQNRVYKKEIAALDAEITRLEQLLDSSSPSTSSNISLLAQQKPEISVITEVPSNSSIPQMQPQNLPKSRTPSITGGLPYLLLSVLPPVIPRASWPSAEYMQIPMRKSVTFASQPHLDTSRSVNDVCLPASDLYNLRLAHQQATESKSPGLFNRIRGIFTRNPSSSNKGSSNSLHANSVAAPNQSGIRAALRNHVGLFRSLLPSTESASCNEIYNKNVSHHASSNTLNLNSKSQFAKSGTDLDKTSIDPNFMFETSKSVGNDVGHSDTKVNFQLPIGRRSSILTNSQPTLRERVKGSPRFPHRILPTNSLSALAEQESPSKIKTVLSESFCDEKVTEPTIIEQKNNLTEESTKVDLVDLNRDSYQIEENVSNPSNLLPPSPHSMS